MTSFVKGYLKAKENCSDALLFYRLGDFYELLFDDAITASKELDLTLTTRDYGENEHAPMSGVPFHSIDKYIAILIGKGYKVAVAESQKE